MNAYRQICNLYFHMYMSTWGCHGSPNRSEKEYPDCSIPMGIETDAKIKKHGGWFPAVYAVHLWKELSFRVLNLDLFVLHKNGSRAFELEWCTLNQLLLVIRGTHGCPVTLSIICTLAFFSLPPHPFPQPNCVSNSTSCCSNKSTVS